MGDGYEAVKLTPIYDAAQGVKACFIERAGWQLPEVFTSVEEELRAARQSVVLADVSGKGKISVQGREAEAVLGQVWPLPPLAIGQGTAVPEGRVYRLRADLFFVSTPPGAESDVLLRLTAAGHTAGDLVTVTDMTHGRAELRHIGPASAELLSRLCGLDFHPSAFPNLTARQSSLAKTTQLIIREDIGALPAYSLVGARSLGAYLWLAIMQAGRDLGIGPLGQAALDRLSETQ
jgi:heterotetrameric sarcosine oxidase gamma subunit